MPQRKHKPEEIVAKLRQVDVPVSPGRPVAEAIRTIGVAPFTYYRWRKEFGGLKSDQVKRLQELEKERAIGTPLVRETMARERLRKAASDLTLEKLICPLNLLSVLLMERRNLRWDEDRQRRSRGRGTSVGSWRRAG